MGAPLAASYDKNAVAADRVSSTVGNLSAPFVAFCGKNAVAAGGFPA